MKFIVYLAVLLVALFLSMPTYASASAEEDNAVFTSEPTASPTFSPTTNSPTSSPTFSPTTNSPTSSPTFSPTSESPTVSPTASPSALEAKAYRRLRTSKA